MRDAPALFSPEMLISEASSLVSEGHRRRNHPRQQDEGLSPIWSLCLTAIAAAHDDDGGKKDPVSH